MIARSICRKVAALAVSYAIAIQAIVSGLLPVSPAAADFRGVLCSAVSSAGAAQELPGQSVPHHDGTICCLTAGCSSPIVAAGDDTAPAAIERRYVPAKIAAIHAQPDDWPSERPRSSRAPPA